MTDRYRPTGKLTKLDPTRELVHLIVDYDDVDEFLADYDQNIKQGMAVIDADRPLEEGTFIQVRIMFPGLVSPLVLDGIARSVDGETGVVRVQVRSDFGLDGRVERIRQRDPQLVKPLIKLLIVEDNPHVAQLVGNGLAASARRELGDVVVTFVAAEDGAAALELLSRKTFDAVIADVYMPILDGPGFIRQVRTSPALRDLPIISMSAGGDRAREAAMSAGASAFLDKPVRLRQVVDAMRQLMKL